MFLITLLVTPFLVYSGWRSGKPLKRRKYVWIYLSALLIVGIARLGASESSSAEQGAGVLAMLAVFCAAPSLGKRCLDAGLNKPGTIAVGAFAFLGVPWIVMLFPRSKRGTDSAEEPSAVPLKMKKKKSIWW